MNVSNATLCRDRERAQLNVMPRRGKETPNNNDNSLVAERLTSLRRHFGWTQDEVADKASQSGHTFKRTDWTNAEKGRNGASTTKWVEGVAAVAGSDVDTAARYLRGEVSLGELLAPKAVVDRASPIDCALLLARADGVDDERFVRSYREQYARNPIRTGRALLDDVFIAWGIWKRDRPSTEKQAPLSHKSDTHSSPTPISREPKRHKRATDNDAFVGAAGGDHASAGEKFAGAGRRLTVAPKRRAVAD